MDGGQVLGGGAGVGRRSGDRGRCGRIVDVDDADAQARALGPAAPRAQIGNAVEPDGHGIEPRRARVIRPQRSRGFANAVDVANIKHSQYRQPTSDNPRHMSQAEYGIRIAALAPNGNPSRGATKPQTKLRQLRGLKDPLSELRRRRQKWRLRSVEAPCCHDKPAGLDF